MESSISHFHLSELGSDWELQHTQSFRIQNPKFSYPGCDQGTNAPTIPCPSGNTNPSSGCPAVVSPVPSSGGSESTYSWNSRTTYQASGAPNLQRNADSVQSEFCLHGPGTRTVAESTSNQYENIEPLQAPHGLGGSQPAFHLFENIEPLQAPHGLGGSQPAFHLFENIEPLQVPHGLGGSQPAFHLFENIEPLQVPHGLGGSQPTFHLFENIEPLQVPDGLGGSQPMTGTQSMFNQYEDSQALRQPFSGTFDDSLVAGRDSSNMYTQMPDDLPSNQPQNPSYQQFTVPVSVN